MHVQFEFNEEDVVDAYQRCLARSGAVKSWRSRGLLLTAALSWSLTFLFFHFMQQPLAGAVLGLFAAAVSGLLYPASHRNAVERRFRRLLEESYGDTWPQVCEVEVGPVGVWVRQFNTQTTHEWESIQRVEEFAGGVELVTRGGCIVVREGAFETDEERRKFVELAEGYVALARAGGPEHAARLNQG
jgi:hypothetical protein